jgi:hypothetical protein
MTDRHAHDRLTFLLGASFGSMVTINTKTGDKFEGIMSGSSQLPDSRVTLKMTKKQHSLQAGQVNGVAAGEAALVGTGPEHTMSFDSKDITEISISELTPAEPTKLPNGMMPSVIDYSKTNMKQVRVLSFRQTPTFHAAKFVASASFNVGFLRQAKTLISHSSLQVLQTGINLRRTRECLEQPVLLTRTITPPPSIGVIHPSGENKSRQTGSHAKLNDPHRRMLTCARNAVKRLRMMARMRRTNTREFVEVRGTSHL